MEFSNIVVSITHGQTGWMESVISTPSHLKVYYLLGAHNWLEWLNCNCKVWFGTAFLIELGLVELFRHGWVW